MIKLLYQAIAQRLQNVFGPSLWVDLWNGQTTQEEAHNFFTPAVFVQFDEITYRTTGKAGQQYATAQITAKVVQTLLTETHSGAASQAQALQLLDFAEQVYIALQDLSSPDFAPFERTRFGFDTPYGSLITFDWVFKTTLTDNSKALSMPYETVTPDLQPEPDYLPLP